MDILGVHLTAILPLFLKGVRLFSVNSGPWVLQNNSGKSIMFQSFGNSKKNLKIHPFRGKAGGKGSSAQLQLLREPWERLEPGNPGREVEPQVHGVGIHHL